MSELTLEQKRAIERESRERYEAARWYAWGKVHDWLSEQRSIFEIIWLSQDQTAPGLGNWIRMPWLDQPMEIGK